MKGRDFALLTDLYELTMMQGYYETGAYNRKYYEDNVKMSTRVSGIAMLDIDDFKLYNDTFGHMAGDVALETVV